MKIRGISLLVFLGLTTVSAEATYFKCEVPNGDTIYQDKPCELSASQEELDLEDGVLGQCRGERIKGVVQSRSEPRDGFWINLVAKSGKQTTLFYSEDSEVRVTEGQYYEGYINREIVFIEGEPFEEVVLTCITKRDRDVAKYLSEEMANQL